MDAATSQESSGGTASRGWRLSKLLVSIAVLLFALGALTAGVRYMTAADFHKERAFRVLNEVGEQLGDFQRTMSAVWRSMPVGFKTQKLEFSAEGGCAQGNKASDQDQYCRLRNRIVGDLVPDYVHRDAGAGDDVCNGPQTVEGGSWRAKGFLLSGDKFDVFGCSVPTNQKDKPRDSFVLRGNLEKLAESRITQDFFDEVLLTLADGRVLASIPRSADLRNPNQVALHKRVPSRLGIRNARAILAALSGSTVVPDPPKACEGDEKACAGEGEKKKSGAMLSIGQPLAGEQIISGERYQVYVGLGRSELPIHVEGTKQEIFYLIGLRKHDTRADVSGAVGPNGKFFLTLLFIIALLLWPLADLRSKGADEPVSWLEAAAGILSLLLLPATFAVGIVWMWSHQSLTAWVDAAARKYADQVENTLHDELTADLRILRSFRALPVEAQQAAIQQKSPGLSCPEGMLIRDGVPARGGMPAEESFCQLRSEAVSADRQWSPLASIYLTAGEKQAGFRYSAFDVPMTRPGMAYRDREYFRLLASDQGWRLHEDAVETTDERFSAQRIFSWGDGSRMLQVAIPRDCATSSDQSGFCGIVSGGSRVHSLSQSVAPLMLRFAVIDRATGRVIFHSDDRRSLAENFFVETEQNTDLRALSESDLATDRFFSGRYMSEDHRFYYRRFEHVPWAVVVFYPSASVGNMTWNAALTALALFLPMPFLAVVIVIVLLASTRNRERPGVKRAIGLLLRGRQPRTLLVLLPLCIAALGSAFWVVYEFKSGGVSRLTWWMLAFILANVAVLPLLVRRRWYVEALMLSLVVVSAAPAAWIALNYQDLQIRGMVRDGLVAAAVEVENRYLNMAADLRRWVFDRGTRTNDFAPAWDLSHSLPVPGFDRRLKSKWQIDLFGRPPLQGWQQGGLDPWRRAAWESASKTLAQQRRIELLRLDDRKCAHTNESDQCSFTTADGNDFSIAFSYEAGAAAQIAASGRDKDSLRPMLAMAMNLLVTAVGLFVLWRLAAFVIRFIRCEASSTCVPAEDGSSCSFRRWALGRTNAPGSPFRIDLLDPAAESRLQHFAVTGGDHIIDNLDAVLTDPVRRLQALTTIEKILADKTAQLEINCHRSPFLRLHHPEHYPDSERGQPIPAEEVARWDHALGAMERRPESAGRLPANAGPADCHRMWRRLTRSERLMLFHLASGHLPNPRNAEIIRALVERQLVKADPWHVVADEGFRRFVLTAQTRRELAEWQRQSSEKRGPQSWKKWLVALFVLALVAVVWLTGEQFKLLHGAVAGAVAFLGLIGQAMSFVRAGGAAK